MSALSIIASMLIVAGVALFVAMPLRDASARARRESAHRDQLELLDHQRSLAVGAIVDLEFDRAMGKLSDADFSSMLAKLEDRALTAMTESDRVRASSRLHAVEKPRAPIVQIPVARPTSPRPPAIVKAAPAPSRVIDVSTARSAGYCPSCGMRIAARAKFCFECGSALAQLQVVSRQSE